jgi:hypothetical protein
MSASRLAADPCSGCGAELPQNARFCPECGTAADAGSTVRAPLPVEETGPTPVTVTQVEPHWFGIAPPELLLGLGAVVLIIAIALFAAGHWPFGLILLGLAALLGAAFLELARRRPRTRLTRTSAQARERAGSAIESWRVRAAAAADARRIHSGLAVVEAERRTVLLELGAAAHQADSTAEAGARARLAELDAREAELNAELATRLESAEERIRLARLPVQETMMVTPSEPYPPPGEATPPQPAVVPEPYPPPDEGTPPAPAPVPEPAPETES